MKLLLLLFTLTAYADYQPFSLNTMRNFHWSIAGEKQHSFPGNAAAYGRDLNWALQNQEKIQELRRSGKKVVCYFNLGRFQADPRRGREETGQAYAGAYRFYREIPVESSCLEKGDAWGEPWINWRGRRNQDVALRAYAKLIREASAVCDGLEYDNTDVYENIPGGKCGSKEDALAVLKRVCALTHESGMNCILKNTFDQADALAPLFDGVIGEQCFTYPENAELLRKAFGGKKPVSCIEYKNADVEKTGYYRRDFAKDCAAARKFGFASLVVETRQSVTGDPDQVCEIKGPARGGGGTEVPGGSHSAQ